MISVNNKIVNQGESLSDKFKDMPGIFHMIEHGYFKLISIQYNRKILNTTRTMELKTGGIRKPINTPKLKLLQYSVIKQGYNINH